MKLNNYILYIYTIQFKTFGSVNTFFLKKESKKLIKNSIIITFVKQKAWIVQKRQEKHL